MLNKIWFALLLVGILYAAGRGTVNSLTKPALPTAVEREEAEGAEEPAPVPLGERDLMQMGKDLNAAAISAAEVSIEICIGLIGIMALWLGLLAVARDAGLVDALARLLSPLMRWLFPEVPDGHPAQGAMLMNISANMLNLDNAATPLGLKAMQELQTLNDEKDTATNSMAMFMAINTSNVTLVPFTIIGYRAISGSENPAEPTLGIILVTTVSTIVAIIATKMLARSPRFATVRPTTSDDAREGLE
ncbi:MAG: nucleoside recognition domain-containing protein [Planctomycetota bacterium]